MPTVEGAGVALHYEQAGAGPLVLLVHGMAGDGGAWAPETAALRDVARVVTYDRRGHGASGAPEPYERTTVSEQAEDAAALLGALGGGPALAAGRDLGALVVVDLLLRHPGLLGGAVLVDAPAYPLVPASTEALGAERMVLEDALRGGGPARAVQAWRALHGDERDHAVAPRAFFADYGAQSTLALTRGELRALSVPVVVLDGPGAPAHVRAAGDALARLVPGARRGGAEAPADALRSLLPLD